MSALSLPCFTSHTLLLVDPWTHLWGSHFWPFLTPPSSLSTLAQRPQSLGVYTNCKSFSLTWSSSFTFASTFHHLIQLTSGLFLGFIVSLLTRIQAQWQQDFLSVFPFTSPQCCQLYLAHGRRGQDIVFVEWFLLLLSIKATHVYFDSPFLFPFFHLIVLLGRLEELILDGKLTALHLVHDIYLMKVGCLYYRAGSL